MKARMLHASLLFERSDVIAAEAELRAALAEGENSADIHSLLGLCLLKAGLVVEARREVEAALAIEPNDAYCHYALSFVESASMLRSTFFGEGQVRFDVKRNQACLTSASRAVELAPGDERYLIRLAEVYQMLEKWRESVKPAEAALRLAPDNVSAAILLAEAMVHLRRRPEARALLDRTLATNPAVSLAHAGMGWAFLHAGDNRRAEHFFNEALRIQADLRWAQEGALECAKYQYWFHRWMWRMELWFEDCHRVAGIAAGLAIAVVVIGAFAAYFRWVDPVMRARLGVTTTGWITIGLIVVGSSTVLYRDHWLLWVVRRQAAAKTTAGMEQRSYAVRLWLLVVVTLLAVPIFFLLEKVSNIAPFIFGSLISGAINIGLAVLFFPSGIHRRRWLLYGCAAFMFIPMIAFAARHFIVNLPLGVQFVLLLVLIMPVAIAADGQRREAAKRKHQNAVSAASRNKTAGTP